MASAQRGPEAFRSVLIALDLSSRAERVTQRAVLLPLARGARLTLLHVIPARLTADARRRAASFARGALVAAAKGAARGLPDGVALEPEIRVGPSATEIVRHARSIDAELIVLGRGRGRVFRDVFLGSTAERVLRQGRLPVLLVRQPPRGRYHRPLVALDLDAAAPDLLALLMRVLPPPRPRMAMVHAYDAPFQALIYPGLSRDEEAEYLRQCRTRALGELARLLCAALPQPLAEELPWESYIRCDYPRTLIPKVAAQLHVDLLALGTHGRAGLANTFLGSVAGDVLRTVHCDVLVVPPGREGSPRT